MKRGFLDKKFDPNHLKMSSGGTGRMFLLGSHPPFVLCNNLQTFLSINRRLLPQERKQRNTKPIHTLHLPLPLSVAPGTVDSTSSTRIIGNKFTIYRRLDAPHHIQNLLLGAPESVCLLLHPPCAIGLLQKRVCADGTSTG